MKRAVLFAGLAMMMSSGVFAQQAPVRVGVLEDLSGIFADVTGDGAIVAAQLAVEDFGPTVLGRKIEVVSADHQNKADIGSAVARKWYDQDGVGLITGLGNTSVALAVRSISRDKGKIDAVTSGGSSELTGRFCSPTGFHWVYNTYALAKAVSAGTAHSPNDTLFLVAADYGFGTALASDAARFTQDAGGKVLQTVRAPLGTPDFSSFILQAVGSKAKNVGLAMAGQDLVNFIKQASEFGLVKGGQNILSFVMFINDIHALGLNVAQGLYFAESFYWDIDDGTRDFAKRFFARRNAMPNGMQAGTYSAVKHYLEAVKAAGTDDPMRVAQTMRELPVADFFSSNLEIRADGRVMRPLSLFKVKAPAESKSAWDLLTRVTTLAGKDVFQALDPACPLVKAP